MSAIPKPDKITAQFFETFCTKIVDRYYSGDIGKALVDLMEKAVIEEELLQAHLDKRKSRLDVEPKKRREGEPLP